MTVFERPLPVYVLLLQYFANICRQVHARSVQTVAVKSLVETMLGDWLSVLLQRVVEQQRLVRPMFKPNPGQRFFKMMDRRTHVSSDAFTVSHLFVAIVNHDRREYPYLHALAP